MTGEVNHENARPTHLHRLEVDHDVVCEKLYVDGVQITGNPGELDPNPTFESIEVEDDAMVTGQLTVGERIANLGPLINSGAAQFNDTIDVAGDATFQDVTINGTLSGVSLDGIGSVELEVPSFFDATGPLTTDGTITITYASGLDANKVLGTDGSGAAGLISLAADHIPELPTSKITSGQLATQYGGTGANLSSAANGSLPYVSSGSFAILAGGTDKANKFVGWNANGSALVAGDVSESVIDALESANVVLWSDYSDDKGMLEDSEGNTILLYFKDEPGMIVPIFKGDWVFESETGNTCNLKPLNLSGNKIIYWGKNVPLESHIVAVAASSNVVVGNDGDVLVYRPGSTPEFQFEAPAGGGGGGPIAIDDVTGLQDALDAIDTDIAGKADSSHSHAESDITGLTSTLTDITGDIDALETAVAGKADTSHTHAISDVTDLQTTLDDLQDQIDGIGGGGSLPDPSGHAGEALVVNGAGDGYELSNLPSTVSTIEGLLLAGLGTDYGGTGKTTADFSGQAGKTLVVNDDEDGFDLADAGGGGGFETGLNGIEIEDEFLKDLYSTTNGIGFNVLTSGTGASAGQTTSYDDDRHMGVVQLSTGSTAFGYAEITTDHAITVENGALTMEAIFRSPGQLSNGTNIYDMTVGFSGSAAPFVRGDGDDNANLMLFTGVSFIDTGVAFTIDTWYYVKLVLSADASQVTATVKSASTTYGPTTSSMTISPTQVKPSFKMQKLNGSSARLAYLDWIRFRASLTDPRV